MIMILIGRGLPLRQLPEGMVGQDKQQDNIVG